MSTSLHVWVMTRDATGTVSFWELSRPSRSTKDAKYLIEHAAEWRDSLQPEKALAVVVTGTGLRPRLIPLERCSAAARLAWESASYLLPSKLPVHLLPEAPDGATML